MGHVQDNADESVRRVIDRLADSEARLDPDQGAIIKVKISVDKAKREATVDFTGTSPQQPTNFNAPEPVTRAAVLYVFRVMVDDDIPMNAGCLRPIRVILPEGSMLSPRYPAAVVAGNVEVSQAVTDTLFAALGALGSAQGTMNNLTFGDARYQYYETICSGAPAGPGFDGASGGAHPHDQFAPDRPGGAGKPLSGGAGGFPHPPRLRRQGPLERRRRHAAAHPLPAADAGRRSSAAIARVPNPGAMGGEPGELGRNSIRRNDGRIECCPAARRPRSRRARRSRSSRRRAGDGGRRRGASAYAWKACGLPLSQEGRRVALNTSTPRFVVARSAGAGLSLSRRLRLPKLLAERGRRERTSDFPCSRHTTRSTRAAPRP